VERSGGRSGDELKPFIGIEADAAFFASAGTIEKCIAMSL
jgi:hypothetical protein